MIFSELYSVYYQTVAKILDAAASPEANEDTLQRIVLDCGFSESVLTILPALRSGKWPLLAEDLTPLLDNPATMPLTLLEKRWLKALLEDPRVRLFGVPFPELEDVQPLFTREDYRIFDQYSDGDPYEEETYIRNFRVLLDAIRTERPVVVTVRDRTGNLVKIRFYPTELEYSPKDDKFRVFSPNRRFREFNLARILDCEICPDAGLAREIPQDSPMEEIAMLITDERNAMERAMLHFAHFEKQTERRSDGNYLLKLRYRRKDRSEMVIRVLSFGPCIQVLEPEEFVQLIRTKLRDQMRFPWESREPEVQETY